MSLQGKGTDFTVPASGGAQGLPQFSFRHQEEPQISADSGELGQGATRDWKEKSRPWAAC